MLCYRDHHEAIISKEVFDAAQAIVAQRAKAGPAADRQGHGLRGQVRGGVPVWRDG